MHWIVDDEEINWPKKVYKILMKDLTEQWEKEELTAKKKLDGLDLNEVLHLFFQRVFKVAKQSAKENIDNFKFNLETVYFEEERDEAFSNFKKGISARVRDDNSSFSFVVESFTDEVGTVDLVALTSYFENEVNNLDTYKDKDDYFLNLREGFKEVLIPMYMFHELKELEFGGIKTINPKKNSGIKKRTKKEPLINTFADLVKQEYREFLPGIKSEFSNGKTKEKVMMLHAMKELEMLNYDFAAVTPQTILHNALVGFFSLSLVGSRTGFTRSVRETRSQVSEHFKENVSYSVKKIKKIISKNDQS